jgi:hypothetical protein
MIRLERPVAVVLMLAACLISPSASAGDADDLLSALEAALSDVRASVDELERYRFVGENSEVGERSEAERAMRSARQAARSAAVSLLLASVDHSKPGDSNRVLESVYILMPELKKKTETRKKK